MDPGKTADWTIQNCHRPAVSLANQKIGSVRICPTRILHIDIAPCPWQNVVETIRFKAAKTGLKHLILGSTESSAAGTAGPHRASMQSPDQPAASSTPKLGSQAVYIWSFRYRPSLSPRVVEALGTLDAIFQRVPKVQQENLDQIRLKDKAQGDPFQKVG